MIRTAYNHRTPNDPPPHGKKTMPIKKDGAAVAEEVNDATVQMVQMVDDILVQFVNRHLSISKSIACSLCAVAYACAIFASGTGGGMNFRNHDMFKKKLHCEIFSHCEFYLFSACSLFASI